MHLFILGDKSYLSNDIVFSFQEIGISHLFAISGMHITLLSSIILKILKKLKISENKRYFITSIFLIIFLLIANTSPSILRGVLFFILFSLNKIYYFHISPINLYIFILSLTLLINPLYIFDIGFKYSFLISGTLIILSNYLHSSNYFISLFKVSFISNFISFPITIKNFYQINILSIFLNIIYVPFISLIVFPLALISLFIKKILPIFTFFTNLLEKTSLYFSSLSIFKLSFVKLPSIIYIIYFILIVLIIFSIIKKRKKQISLLL